MNFTYAVFGLLLHSNLELPQLTRVDSEFARPSLPRAWHAPAINVRLNMLPHECTSPGAPEELRYSSPYQDGAGNPSLKIWKTSDGSYLRLAYFDGTQFWLDREGAEIWATWPSNLTVEDTATYLLGPVLGLVLRLRGVMCLHASAVAFGDRAVAFVGSDGAGKSTTAAALALRGHAILADDVVALAERDGSFLVHPAYPYLCLWPESVQSIYGSADALPQFSPNYEKRCLALGKRELRFEERPLPLAAIYILGERRGDPAPILDRISPRDEFLALVTNTFATNVLDGGMRAREFKTLSRLVPTVEIRQLCAHRDSSRLPELCRMIEDDVRRMAPLRPASPE